MKTFKMMGILFCLAAVGAIFAPHTWASKWNKKTIITIDQPLLIPGAKLAPGTYVFKLVDSLSNRNIVRVLNEEETQVIVTILATPNYRLQPTGKSEFSFWEMPKGYPDALRSWFYPGDNYGQEFAYPKHVAAEIAAAAQDPVPSIADEMEAKLSVPRAKPDDPEPEEFKTTPITQEKPKAVASVKPSSPAAPRTETPSTQKTAEVAMALPKTASLLPLVGLMGLLWLGMAFVVRAIRNQIS